MLDIKIIREHPELLKETLEKRGMPNPWEGTANELTLERFLALEKDCRSTLHEIEQLRTRRNQIAEEFPKLKKQGKDISILNQEVTAIKTNLSTKEKRFAELENKFNDALLRIPNFIHSTVPLGKGPEDNLLVRQVGEAVELPFTAREHWAIGEALGILDFAAAGKISGSRFSVLKGAGALLERVLIQWMLDLHIHEGGYGEVATPYLVHAQSMQGTGQLPRFEEEMFWMERDGLYLIPTAEVSVTNLHRDEILDEGKLPRKYVCYSACFRREAGSYGKDTKGLIRNHQFNKVELVWFSKPERSFEDLEILTQDAEKVLQKLEIPYRVMLLCSGDIGFGASKTYDLEVWMPGEKRWREISSCSCFTDFQARRMNIKYKTPLGKKALLHTLNGSGVAVGRLFAAILENYQTPDGTVRIPQVLQPYLKLSKLV